jgi:hypothetical protein
MPEQPFAADANGLRPQKLVGFAIVEIDHAHLVALPAQSDLPPRMIETGALRSDQFVLEIGTLTAHQPADLSVGGGSADAFARQVAGFRKGLGETGYVEGQNVTVESRPERTLCRATSWLV